MTFLLLERIYSPDTPKRTHESVRFCIRSKTPALSFKNYPFRLKKSVLSLGKISERSVCIQDVSGASIG